MGQTGAWFVELVGKNGWLNGVTLKCEKDSFSRKGLLLSRKGARGMGSGLIHGYYFNYYKYKICLDDILNCFGETFAIFSEFIDFVFTSLCEKGFGFQEKDLG